VQVERVAGEVGLHLETEGAGPVLCLAHGFGGSARNFRPQARALKDSWRTALFDLRGHARSEAPVAPEAYAPECLAADFGRVLDHLRVECAVVGGLSMGAGLALRFASSHRERVRALVLAAFPPGVGEAGGRHRSWALDFAAAIERDGLEAAGALYVWGERSGFDPGTAKLVKLGFLEHPPHAIVNTLRRVLAQQPSVDALAPELARLDVPVLVVVGGRDRLSLEPCRALAAALPHAEFEVIEGSGHVVNLAARDAFNARLVRFLAGLTDSR